jgi:CheY-like chemotaxis protein
MLNTEPYIIIAEDDEDDVLFLKDELSHLCPKIDCLHFSDGGKAVDYLNACPEDNHPRLIVIDYNMPFVSGADLLEFLRSQDRFKPIIKAVWTSSPRLDEHLQCLALGADLFFVKPSSTVEWRQFAEKIAEQITAEHPRRPRLK